MTASSACWWAVCVVRGLVGTREGGVTVVVDGQTVDAVVLDERAARLASAAAGGRPRTSETAFRAPMPGPGGRRPGRGGPERGERHHPGRALGDEDAERANGPGGPTVKEVLVAAGQTVDQNQVLVRLA